MALDVSYGAITYGNSLGCGSPNEIVLAPNQQVDAGANLQALAKPCFYMVYYGILGGGALTRFLLVEDVRTELQKF